MTATPPEATGQLTGFASLGLDERVLGALAALGYEEPTPIQRAAIPALITGRDVLAQAATGTGKTAAFAIPLLHRLTPDAPPRERTSALVLVPTRELAMQVAEAIYRYGKNLHIQVLPIYGGVSIGKQIGKLDHINLRTHRLEQMVEWYDRVLRLYEDQKCHENGDVYSEVL